MTHTVDTPGAAGRPGDEFVDRLSSRRPGAVFEQATGALIFRYSIGAEAAASLMELWAAEAGVPPAAVARAIVLDICQGLPGAGSDPRLVRWLEDRLRQEVALAGLAAPPGGGSSRGSDPGGVDASVAAPVAEDRAGTTPYAAARKEATVGLPARDEAAGPVVVAVDHSDVSLDAVVRATRRAARLGVALQITADPDSVRAGGEAGRAHLAQRVVLAVELARKLEPGLEVRRPEAQPPEEGAAGRG